MMGMLLSPFERHPICCALMTIFGLGTLAFHQQIMFSLFPWYMWALMGLLSIRYVISLLRMNERDRSLESDVPTTGIGWLDGVFVILAVAAIARIIWWMFFYRWSYQPRPCMQDVAFSFVMLSGTVLVLASLGGLARLIIDIQKLSKR